MSRPGSIWREGQCLWPRARKAMDPWSRARGLLGRRQLSTDEALWLSPCGAVHMWGMAFALDLVWLDAEGRILELRPHLRPWRWAWPKAARVRDTLELRAGEILHRELQIGQILQWRAQS